METTSINKNKGKILSVLLIAVIGILITWALGTADAAMLEKTVDKTTSVSGGNLTYNIKLNFTENAGNVTINDYLPEGLIYLNCSHNCTQNGRNIIWNLGNKSGVVGILLNVSINETYNGTEIVNTVNLSYEVNSTEYKLNATSNKTKIINKTKILFVVKPNWEVLQKAFPYANEHYIDCEFANLTAMTLAATDESYAEYVKEKIRDANEGDIIFEYIADRQYELYKDEIKNASNRGVKIIGIGGFTSGAGYTYNIENGSCVLKKIFGKRLSSSNPIGYWDAVLEENMKQMVMYIAYAVDNRSDLKDYVKDPIGVPEYAIYHPIAPYLTYNNASLEHLFLNTTNYVKWYNESVRYNPEKPWIGIVMYYRDYQTNDLLTENKLIEKLENDSFNVIASYVAWNTPISRFFYDEKNKTLVGSVITFNHFNANGPPSVLSKLNVPVIQAIYPYYNSIYEWYNSSFGLNGLEITWKIDQPEMDGTISPIVVQGVLSAKTGNYYVIDDIIEGENRIDRITGIAENYAMLGWKPNPEKKIAMIYFNHPPGKHDIGASYFNLFPSLENALGEMNKSGYNVSAWNKTEIKDKIMAGGRNIGVWAPDCLNDMVNNGSVLLLPAGEYESWFNELPEKIRNDVNKTWGPPPGELMVYENATGKYIVIPRIENGNIILAPQPNRGWEADVSRVYHDMTIAPPHNYIAFYLWLKKDFDADAVVHWGRHGTLEWLPGKMIGMSKDSYPDLLIQDIPNIYPYIIDGSGEGIQAKRRGYATLISHLTPPIAQSELYGELQDLKDLIVEYEKSNDVNYTAKIEILKAEIMAKAQNMSIDKDLNITLTNETMDEAVEEIIEYLEELSGESMPYGTHTFGEAPGGEKKMMFIEIMLINLADIHVTSADILGYDWNNLNENPLVVVNNITNSEMIDKTKNLTKFIAGCIIENKTLNWTVDEIQNRYNLTINQTTLPALNETYNSGILWSKALDNTPLELENYIDALNGGYIEPSEQGDPARNPDVLPTGRNYYALNSKLIPTKTSWELGKKLADELIKAYYEKHGEFPDKIGATMWSVETYRHYGVMEGMVLRLLGVEPIITTSKTKNDEVKVTALENLTIEINGTIIQRPRIDVVITTSGLYRDTLPYQVCLFDIAVKTVANLNENESDNYVIKNSKIINESLMQLNESLKDRLLNEYKLNSGFNVTFEEFADLFSKLRIFAPPPGGYGAGIDKIIDAGELAWNISTADKEVGDAYIFRMANMYSCGQSLGNYRDVFKQNLNGTDIIFNSRSTNLYGILDNDDVYQYTGGFAIAVRSITGETPEVKIINLRNIEKPKIEDLYDFLAKELRTRLFNPNYLKGMMESEYSGLREIADFIENLFGWDVTVPDAVREDQWDEAYDVLINDKYGLGLEDAFSKDNPYALQSITARMLEAIRKGYWDPSDEVKKDIAGTYKKSVEDYGATCCHHTCGNPFLNDYVRGILSVPVQDVPKTSYSSRMPASQLALNTTISPPTNTSASSNNTGEAISDATGTGEIEEKNDTAITSHERPSLDASANETKTEGVMGEPITPSGETVTGKKMEETSSKTETESPLPISGAPLIGILIVIAILIIIIYGYLRKKK